MMSYKKMVWLQAILFSAVMIGSQEKEHNYGDGTMTPVHSPPKAGAVSSSASHYLPGMEGRSPVSNPTENNSPVTPQVGRKVDLSVVAFKLPEDTPVFVIPSHDESDDQEVPTEIQQEYDKRRNIINKMRTSLQNQQGGEVELLKGILRNTIHALGLYLHTKRKEKEYVDPLIEALDQNDFHSIIHEACDNRAQSNSFLRRCLPQLHDSNPTTPRTPSCIANVRGFSVFEGVTSSDDDCSSQSEDIVNWQVSHSQSDWRNQFPEFVKLSKAVQKSHRRARGK